MMEVEKGRPHRSSQPRKYIEHFEVVDLHGSQNILLEFSSPFGVFIADNGSGKTTALYLLQCLLRRDFPRMLRFAFTEIKFQFHGGEMKSLLSSSLRKGQGGRLYRLLGRNVRPERHREILDMQRLASLS